ncbi:MAG: ArnT family glycosyltransferase [Candidatus Sumerlaeia bacterium]
MSVSISARKYLWGLCVLMLVLFFIRRTGPEDFMELGQHYQLAYIMDVLANGNWIMPHGVWGDVASKPPLSVWLSAILILPFQWTSPGFCLTLAYIPSALASLGMAFLIFHIGRRCFDERIGILGAFMWALSYFGFRSLTFLRADPLFGFLTFLSACLAFQAMRRDGGWIFFWLIAALATLAKGPLTLLLVLGGFILCRSEFWRKPDGMTSRWRGFGLGLIFYLAIILSWFLVAMAAEGNRVAEKQIGNELFGHLLSGEEGSLPLSHFWQMPYFFIVAFLPWSIPAMVGLVRVFRKPPEQRKRRLAAQYLAGYFVFGLIVFSIAPHQRAYYLMPLIPAACLLGAPVLLEWKEKWIPRERWPGLILAFSLLFIAIAVNYIYIIRPNHHSYYRYKCSKGMKYMIEPLVEAGLPLTFTDTPYALQYLLGIHQEQIPRKEARKMLLSDKPAYVVVNNAWKLIRGLPDPDENGPYLLMQFPDGLYPFFSLYSNQRSFAPEIWQTAVSDNPSSNTTSR